MTGRSMTASGSKADPPFNARMSAFASCGQGAAYALGG